MNHQIDHALTTISCTLDDMEAVLLMMMEVESANKELALTVNKEWKPQMTYNSRNSIVAFNICSRLHIPTIVVNMQENIENRQRQ